MRNAKIEQFLHQVDTQAVEKFTDLPQSLRSGVRTLFLLERNKDGGHNKEEKRVFNFAVTFSEEEFIMKLKEFMWIKLFWGKELRIYMSVNDRDIHRAMRNMSEVINESHYADQLNKDLVAKKIVKGSRAYIMNPNAKATKFFLLDVDDIEGRDVMGETLQAMAELDVVEVYRKRTKNGWHVVTLPFNPTKWTGPAEIKKDGLLLLDY